MKNLVYAFILLFFLQNDLVAKSETDSIFYELNQVLNQKDTYVKEKEQRIKDSKKMLEIPNLTDSQYYSIYKELHGEYSTYKMDSALYYLEKNLVIAEKIKNQELIYETKLGMSFLNWTLGRYFESLNILESLDRNVIDRLPKRILIDYYGTYKQLFSYYASDEGEFSYYAQKVNDYRDTLLTMLPKHDQFYKTLTAEKYIAEKRYEDAEQVMQDLLIEYPHENRQRAIYANMLGNIYALENNRDLQKKYYAMSAICDIKNAIKENSSLRILAIFLYEEGDINNAYRFINSSMDDAIFCNARFRTFEMSKIFPIINTAYEKKSSHQQAQLKKYLLLSVILSMVLIASLIYTFAQMKRVNRMRKELSATNDELKKLNTDLESTNEQLNALNKELTDVNLKLSETNIIKETYLGKFIDLCSSYIEKLDNYRRSLNKIASTGKVEELYKTLKSSKFVDLELNEFHSNFDETFLRIYPTFIAEFNALFPESERQVVKPGELLNTELRIYALIRLGINDSAKIAIFLRYSITTVYTYRSKLKNKSLFKDNLEEEVMKIGIYF